MADKYESSLDLQITKEDRERFEAWEEQKRKDALNRLWTNTIRSIKHREEQQDECGDFNQEKYE
jgi:hypothetical protein